MSEPTLTEREALEEIRKLPSVVTKGGKAAKLSYAINEILSRVSQEEPTEESVEEVAALLREWSDPIAFNRRGFSQTSEFEKERWRNVARAVMVRFGRKG